MEGEQGPLAPDWTEHCFSEVVCVLLQFYLAFDDEFFSAFGAGDQLETVHKAEQQQLHGALLHNNPIFLVQSAMPLEPKSQPVSDGEYL